MKVVIGLVGVKTSGKSTTADIMKKNLQSNVIEAALADKLKNVCSEVFNVSRESFDRQDLKEIPFNSNKILTKEKISLILTGFGIKATEDLINLYDTKNITDRLLSSPRQIAQIVGTEVLRAAGDEDIHCKNVNLGDNVTIISDVRFPNEFNYFNTLSNTMFLPFYIQRNEAEEKITQDSHPSETSVFIFRDKCIKINNNEGLQSLEEQIRAHLRRAGFELKGHNL
jgi:hypothetical protein